MPDLNLNIPDLGDVEEVEVVEVCVEIGQSVEAEDSILILETDKAAMEIPTTESGIVKNILVNVGDMVKEGTPFVQIEVEEEKKSNTDQIAQKNKKKAHNKKKSSILTLSKHISPETHGCSVKFCQNLSYGFLNLLLLLEFELMKY